LIAFSNKVNEFVDFAETKFAVEVEEERTVADGEVRLTLEIPEVLKILIVKDKHRVPVTMEFVAVDDTKTTKESKRDESVRPNDFEVMSDLFNHSKVLFQLSAK
jgi:hypothetical protein